jgi:hypothetical protein
MCFRIEIKSLRMGGYSRVPETKQPELTIFEPGDG